VDGNSTIYKIDDGSDCVNVRHWAPPPSPEDQSFREGKYIRVCGQLKENEGNRELLAYQIQPITDFNEITYHHLNVVYAHLFRVKGPAKPDAPGVASPHADRHDAGFHSSLPSPAAPDHAAASESDYVPVGFSEGGRFGKLLSDVSPLIAPPLHHPSSHRF
jgi:replication factor A2